MPHRMVIKPDNKLVLGFESIEDQAIIEAAQRCLFSVCTFLFLSGPVLWWAGWTTIFYISAASALLQFIMRELLLHRIIGILIYHRVMLYCYQPIFFFAIIKTGGILSPFMVTIAISPAIIPHASFTIYQSRLFTLFLTGETAVIFLMTQYHLLPATQYEVTPVLGLISFITIPFFVHFVMEDAHNSMMTRIETLLQLNRDKNLFVAQTSHEMRTPLMTIIGWVDFMLRDLRKQIVRVDTCVDRLQTIRQAAETLIAIVTDILEISKVEDGTLALESRAHDAIAMRIWPDVSFEVVNMVPPDCYVRGDPNRLAQIIVNLLTNAAKFTEHGRVVFRAETLDPKALPPAFPWDSLPVLKASEVAIAFTVADTGVGMSPEMIKRLLDPYGHFRINAGEPTVGLGLGLSIVRRLVEKMGGRINLQSKEGRGTTVVFYVVLEKATRKSFDRITASERERGTIRFAGKRVLLAEDNKMNQVLIKKMLEEMGCTCETADDGREAVSMAGGTKFDFVLMDYLMPTMNGIEATQMIRNSSPLNSNIPIFALSASSDVETRSLISNAGLNGFISKPVTLSQLRVALESYFDDEGKQDQ